MYGWRGRVGIVNPSRGDVLMYEYYLAAPDGIIVVPAALNVRQLTAEQLDNVLNGLQAAGARRIAIGAPYTAELTAKFADYFTAAGFEVVATKCLGIERNVDIAL